MRSPAFHRSFALGALVLLVGSCTDEGEPGGAPPAPTGVSFGPFGSASAPSGKGSFRFGVSSAATQIEDRNPDVDWNLWTAPAPEGLAKGPFVGEASGGYTRALEDVALLQELKVDSYRFSMEWARIEPRRHELDEEALAHYGALLDALKAAGIRPMVTIHHFSAPVWLDDPRDIACAAGPTDQNLCGWNHPEAVAAFAEHATLLATRFGDRVDEWGTLNEPVNYLLSAYGIGLFPPGKRFLFGSVEEELVPTLRNLILGHAAAYDALKAADTVDADGDGVAASVGFAHATALWVAASQNQLSTNPVDVAARDRIDWVYNRLFVEAIRQGKLDTDLDGEPDEELPGVAGKLDWLGVQYYFRTGVTGDPGLMPVLALTPCFGEFDLGSCVPPLDPSYTVPAMGYEHLPQGLYEILSEFSGRWPELPLIVTESGIATENGRRRGEAVVRALEAIARARDEGADVRGYYHWSVYDNFEWAEGFTPRFGLYRVDYASFARTPTEGAVTFGEVAGARAISEELGASHGGLGPMTPE